VEEAVKLLPLLLVKLTGKVSVPELPLKVPLLTNAVIKGKVMAPEEALKVPFKVRVGAAAKLYLLEGAVKVEPTLMTRL